MPTPDPSITTIKQLLALPDDGLRHELLQGEHVVTETFSVAHQSASQEIFARFWAYSQRNPELMVFYSPSEVHLGPATLVQPDIFATVIDPENPPTDFREMGVPTMIAEIVSPETVDRDRSRKRDLYLAVGVAEYWVIATDSKLIERWRPGDDLPEIEQGTLEWQPAAGLETMRVDLREVFRRLGG